MNTTAPLEVAIVATLLENTDALWAMLALEAHLGHRGPLAVRHAVAELASFGVAELRENGLVQASLPVRRLDLLGMVCV
jgi:hypothetical protein